MGNSRNSIALVLALLALAVIISGCVENEVPSSAAPNIPTPPAMPPSPEGDSGGSAAVSGDIPTGDESESGVLIDEPASVSGESVDLGSLI